MPILQKVGDFDVFRAVSFCRIAFSVPSGFCRIRFFSDVGRPLLLFVVSQVCCNTAFTTYCTECCIAPRGAGGDVMNITQAKRSKAGHAAQPPPHKKILKFKFAYANSVYGFP